MQVEEDVVIDMLSSFVGVCMNLRQFVVTGRTHCKGAKIADACCGWRFRRADAPYIHILGIDYFK